MRFVSRFIVFCVYRIVLPLCGAYIAIKRVRCCIYGNAVIDIGNGFGATFNKISQIIAILLPYYCQKIALHMVVLQ